MRKRKPKYTITKAQLRKRANRRLVTKPARQQAKREINRIVFELYKGAQHG